MKKLYYPSIILFLSLLFFSCTKDNPVNTAPAENDKLISQMKTIVDSMMKSTQFSGIAVIVSDNKKGLTWNYAAGYASIPDKKPLTINNTFRVGSCTKTMVATVALQLIDEGKLSFDDKLSKFFPGFPKSDSITVKMLINMTTGIFEYAADSIFNATLINNPTKVWAPVELINLAFRHPFDFSPGTNYAYNNTNYQILGLVIEKVTGKALKTELEQRIFQKLNLTNIGFLTSGLTFPGDNAKGYYFGPYIENDEYTSRYDISWAWAAGSAYSTPLDLQKYVEALVRGGLLSPTMQQKRLVEGYHDEGDGIWFYGLGMKRFGTFYGHTGGLHGYQTNMFHSKEKNATIIILYSCTLYPNNPFQLTEKILNLLYGSDY